MKSCLYLSLLLDLSAIYCSITQINRQCEAYKKQFGNDLRPGDFPHVAALAYRDDDGFNFKCGAVIVSGSYVIAPAHCAVTLTGGPEFVRVGVARVPAEISNLDTRNDYKVKKVKVHPNYNRRQFKNNIALIELETAIVFNNDTVKPACLDTRNNTQDLVLSEWGQDGDFLVLHKVKVDALSNEKCNGENVLKLRNLTLDDSQMCASNECAGNLGGPLQVANGNLYTLIALPSFGVPCVRDTNTTFTTVYTKVYNYLYWIQSLVWP